MARVKLLFVFDSGGPVPTESHISTFPFGNTAWKIGTTEVEITGLQAPPWPGSWAATAEIFAFGTVCSSPSQRACAPAPATHTCIPRMLQSTCGRQYASIGRAALEARLDRLFETRSVRLHAIVKSIPAAGFDYRDDVPEPELESRQVRIEVAAASICGTDRELVNCSTAAQALALRLPVILGHEFSGTVIETGSAVARMNLPARRCMRCYAAGTHWQASR
jgi:Alcohol dehydrogenase GroES-like domain